LALLVDACPVETPGYANRQNDDREPGPGHCSSAG
jgi:hypothetical protein